MSNRPWNGPAPCRPCRNNSRSRYSSSASVSGPARSAARRLGKILSILLVFLLAGAGQGLGRDYLDLTAEVRRLPLAVPYLVEGTTGTVTEAGKDYSDILGRGLTLHGIFNLIPAVSYGGGQDNDWTRLGAELVVLGRYQAGAAGGQLTLELRLMDMADNGAMLLGRRYRGDKAMATRMLLRFCDEAIKRLTGETGVASTLIAFVQEQDGVKEIMVADPLGLEIRQLTRHRSIAVSPRFSADGSKLLYTSYHRGRQVLYLTAPNAATTRAVSWRPGLNLAPAWSPTDDLIALTLSQDEHADLYLVGTDAPRGKQLPIRRRLTRNAGINVSPSWSPDGRHLAFVSDRGGTPQIYVMDLASGRSRRLTFQGGYNTSPAWSPKGDLIAYASLEDGAYQIYTIPAAGGDPLRLTRSWGSFESPSWSPDGRQLVVTRKRNSKQEICAIFKSGTGLRVLYHLEGNQSMPQWSPRLAY